MAWIEINGTGTQLLNSDSITRIKIIPIHTRREETHMLEIYLACGYCHKEFFMSEDSAVARRQELIGQ